MGAEAAIQRSSSSSSLPTYGIVLIACGCALVVVLAVGAVYAKMRVVASAPMSHDLHASLISVPEDV